MIALVGGSTASFFYRQLVVGVARHVNWLGTRTGTVGLGVCEDFLHLRGVLLS
jgi:hypothetical protein